MPDEPVPDADAFEQDLPVQEPPAEGTPDLDLDLEVPEADAIEQAQPGPLFDEDEMRD